MASTAFLRRATRGSLIGLMVCCSAFTSAQEKPSREREALRRTQLALRGAQERQAALQAERDKLAESLAQSDKRHAADVATTVAATDAAQRQLRAARETAGALTTTQAELAAAKRAADDNRAKLEAELQALRSQSIDQQRQLAERSASNVAVTRLLEQSVTALARAEADNRQLYAVGQDLLKAYRDKGVLDAAAQRDPVLGFGEVRLENRAEALRDRMDKLRLKPVGAAPAR